jgi:hypothetical protein
MRWWCWPNTCARAWPMPAVRAQVQADLERLLAEVNRQVADYEQLCMIVIAGEAWRAMPWSIEDQRPLTQWSTVEVFESSAGPHPPPKRHRKGAPPAVAEAGTPDRHRPRCSGR